MVGAGPAGLAVAHELTDRFNVTIVEQRKSVGGAGLTTDGKLNFHHLSGGDLSQFLSEPSIYELFDYMDQLFQRYGFDGNEFYNEKYLLKLEEKAEKHGIEFRKIRQKHIGTDRLRRVLENFKDNIEKRGVEFRFLTRFQDIEYSNNCIESVITSNGSIKCDYLVLALGQTGSLQMKELYDKLELGYNYPSPVDIGVRLEVPSDIFFNLINEYSCWDPKFIVRAPSGYNFRTFCTSPGGFVIRDHYGNRIYGVNGHSLHSRKSPNANFALLASYLPEGIDDATDIGLEFAREMNKVGRGRPVMQKLGNLENNKPTSPTDMEIGTKPTLRTTPANISEGYPKWFINDILETLDKLEYVIPGICTYYNNVYAPEVKFKRKIKTQNRGGYLTFQTRIPNLFVCGDGSGYTGGIVPAFVTGLIVARQIKGS